MRTSLPALFSFFFFNDPATTEIYPLPLHDALPICSSPSAWRHCLPESARRRPCPRRPVKRGHKRSEEHTSELQSPCNLVCRLLLEKKKKQKNDHAMHAHGGDIRSQTSDAVWT